MDKKQNQIHHPDVGEDVTQYGEFVSSYFAWVPLPNQKERAKEMSSMTKGTDKTVTVPKCSMGQLGDKKNRP